MQTKPQIMIPLYRQVQPLRCSGMPGRYGCREWPNFDTRVLLTDYFTRQSVLRRLKPFGRP